MEGTTIPTEVLDAKLLTESKEETSLSKLLSNLPSGYKGIVTFLFPAVNTPFCTKQACSFGLYNPFFKDLGYEVYGLTGGASEKAKSWVEKNKLSFTVLLDPQWTVIKHLQCTWMYFIVNRSHLVISRDGKILAIERGVSAKESAERMLEIVKALPPTAE
ncbi:Peroxiredoxin Q [Babesia sp. Xinjiang]|uniref:Peroxiredoxin Q n=1 Tax=Babesia sp. Xinjiang TaxID=462227 RepID=UPI000A23852C|nr:Peroxiredoxin Q [Babesia sp. Xinjiang]ORM39650.1 Peroxiredoxin Q [Babesia sp. Xinjiang]